MRAWITEWAHCALAKSPAGSLIFFFLNRHTYLRVLRYTQLTTLCIKI